MGSYQAAITPCEEDYDIDNLDKIHLQKKQKTYITRVSILTSEIAPHYRCVGERRIDLKI